MVPFYTSSDLENKHTDTAHKLNTKEKTNKKVFTITRAKANFSLKTNNFNVFLQLLVNLQIYQ